MRQFVNKFKSAMLIFMAAVLGLSLVSPAVAYAATGEYTTGDSTIALDVNLTGSSINDHTIPYKLWTNTDKVYVAVKSTHELQYMTLKGVTNTGQDNYDAWVNITIDGTSYAPEGLNGSTNKSHWTVFSFPLSSIAGSTDNSFAFFVKGIGGGHDVGGYFEVTIPTVTINVSKKWIDGPKTPVSVQIYHQVGNEVAVAYGSAITLSIDKSSITLTNVPYTDNLGRVYTYSFKESTPGEGYKVTYTSTYDKATMTYTFALTNTYTSPEIVVTGIKQWSGGENFNGGVRPDVQLQLYQGDTAYGDVVTLSHPVTTHEWTVPKTDKGGVDYTYTVREVGTPANYESSHEGMVVTNIFQIPTDGSAIANKVWDGGPANSRPDTWFQLYRQITGGLPQAVDGAIKHLPSGTEEVEWTDLERTDASGNEYTFSVREVDATGADFTPENYTKSGEGTLTITNTYQSPTDNIEATKIWRGGEALDGRPSVWFELYRQTNDNDREVVPGAEVKELVSGAISVVWDNIATNRQSDGAAYTFSVQEVDADGNDFIPANYRKSGEGTLTVTNTYESPKIAITASKMWVNGPVLRPAIDLTLYRQINGVTDASFSRECSLLAQEVTSEGVVSCDSWTDLDQTNFSGEAYEYYIQEGSVDSYSSTIPAITVGNWELTVTNQYIVPTGPVTGYKVWVNGLSVAERPGVMLGLCRTIPGSGVVEAVPGQDRLEPTTAHEGLPAGVALPNESDRYETYTVQWDGVDMTRESDGAEYEFTVREFVEGEGGWIEVGGESGYAIENYQTTYTKTTAINTYTSPLVDVSVTKNWHGGGIRPDVQVQLQRNGVDLVDSIVTLTQLGGFTHTWENLPKTDLAGVDFTYAVKEIDEIPNFTASYDKASTYSLIVNNTYTSPKIPITATKTWNGGKERTGIEVNLLQNNTVVKTASLSEGNNWTVTWTDLDKTDREGVNYTYAIEEVTSFADYEPILSRPVVTEDSILLNVTNHYIIPKTAVTAFKVWEGGKDRPDVEVQLYRNSEAMDGYIGILSADFETPWQYRWTNLDKTDFDGNPYTYTIKEVSAVANYTPVVSDDGLTITNKYVSPKINYIVNKIWKDNFATHPDVRIQLYRNGIALGDAIILVGGVTSYTWVGLDETDFEGNVYSYTVDEVGTLANYTKQVSGNTITNTYVPPQGHILPSAWSTLADTGDSQVLQMMAGALMIILSGGVLMIRRKQTI